jgi:hypothetical protein
MERISQQCRPNADLAFKVLSWVTFAKRLLKPEELQDAVAITHGMTSLDDDDLTDVEDLLSFCAGIVIVDRESNIVRLVHYTTQGFLEDRVRDRKVDVALGCLSYFKVVKDPVRFYAWQMMTALEDFRYNYPLVGYALEYWADHIRGELEDEHKADCLHAFSRQWIRFLVCNAQRDHSRLPVFNVYEVDFEFRCPLLPILAAYGLAGLCREFLEKESGKSNMYVPLRDSRSSMQ